MVCRERIAKMEQLLAVGSSILTLTVHRYFEGTVYAHVWVVEGSKQVCP